MAVEMTNHLATCGLPIEDRIFFVDILPNWTYDRYERDHANDHTVSVFWRDIELVVPFLDSHNSHRDRVGLVFSRTEGAYNGRRADAYDGMRRLAEPIHNTRDYAFNDKLDLYECMCGVYVRDRDFQAKALEVVETIRAAEIKHRNAREVAWEYTR